MSLMGRYIAASVFKGTLAVLLAVVGLDLVFSVLDELGSLTGQYGFKEAVFYLLLRLPERFYLFLPIAILVGVLIGLGSLASTSELTVMRAAGMSIPRLIMHAAKPAAGLLLLAMLSSEYLLLQWVQAAETYRWEKRTGQERATVSSARDLWLREGLQFYRVNLARDDGRLMGITLFELNEDWTLKRTLSAPRADYDGETWQLRNAREVTLGAEQLTETLHSRLALPLPIQPEFVALQATDPRDLPPSQLWYYARYLEERGQASGFYWLAFWQKVLLPVTVFAVVLLGASFTFGPLRSVPAGTRVFHGIIIGLSVKFTQDLLGPSALLWGFTPALAVVIPAIFCACWGLWLIRRAG